MQIVDLPVDSLIPDPNNSRKHDDKNIAAIKGSLSKFGQHELIVIDDKNIVLSGNARLQVAKDLGWKTIKCLKTDLKSETEKTALKIAMNRAGELASWDMDVLGEELQALREDGFEIEEIGFDLSFLDGWDSDISDSINKIDENLDGITSIIKISCPQDIKDEVISFLKANLANNYPQAEIE